MSLVFLRPLGPPTSAYHCYKAAGFKETGEQFKIQLFGEMWTDVELKMEREEYEALIYR